MNIGIVGLGLIGGSLARAIKKNTSHTVYGYDTNDDVMLKATLMNAIDDKLDCDNARTVDVLAVALYPSSTIDALKYWSGMLKDGAIVFDCVGEKRRIVAEMKVLSEEYPNINYLGIHPMAGREYSGIDHAIAGLYEKCCVIATPVKADIAALAAVKKLWTDIGSEGMVITDADNHDKMISYTSQLAHIVSNAYVRSPLADKHYGYSAGSFRDMTRVARINPDMWAELMLDNRDNLIENVELFISNMTECLRCLKEGDRDGLRNLLAEGNEKKLDIESDKAKKLAESLKK